MKRKLVQHGSSTLTVTLPSKWIRRHALKKGDEVDVEENELTTIRINPGNNMLKEESIKVDLQNLDRTSIILLVQSLYKYGYNLIEFTYNKNTVSHFRINESVDIQSVIYDAVSRLIGAEIVSSSTDGCIIKYITKDSEKDFQIILRRIFGLLSEMFNIFSQALEKNNKSLIKSLEFQHINLKKFINYCLRLLNKYGYSDVKKTCFYFSIIGHLSKIEDLIKNAARIILKEDYKFNKSSIEIISKFNAFFNLFYNLFYDYNIKNGYEFIKKREEIKQDTINLVNQLQKKELFIVATLSQIIEILLDSYELRISLEEYE